MAGDRFDEHQGHGVHVGPSVERHAPGLFRRRVPHGADDALGEDLGAGRFGQGPGQAEVADSQTAVFAEQQVGRFDVSVDESLAVGVFEGPAGFETHHQGL